LPVDWLSQTIGGNNWGQIPIVLDVQVTIGVRSRLFWMFKEPKTALLSFGNKKEEA
jgi:hypothetical protein